MRMVPLATLLVATSAALLATLEILSATDSALAQSATHVWMNPTGLCTCATLTDATRVQCWGCVVPPPAPRLFSIDARR